MEQVWEDHLLERKTEGDLKDLLKTMVAFANSVRPEHTAIILIGEKDEGAAAGVTNPDNIQKKIRDEADKIYPPIIWRSLLYQKDSKDCVRVEIEYSGNTPHFGGAAWVRQGSTTIKATEEIFQKLIDLRSQKVVELSKWVGKEVTLMIERRHRAGSMEDNIYNPTRPAESMWSNKTADCISVNGFWVSLKYQERDIEKAKLNSYSLDYVSLSFDNKNERLMIIVRYLSNY